MAKKIVLRDQIYNIKDARERKYRFTNYQKYLEEISKGFPATRVRIKKLRKFDQRFEVLIQGPEEVFVSNLLRKEIGALQSFEEIQKGTTLEGNMVNVGEVGFGIFVDCGITNPPTDVLLPLYTLREQLCAGKKVSVREIINAYDFRDHFPVYVEITDVKPEKKELSGKLAPKTLRLFDRLLDEGIEALCVMGATKNQVKKAIEQRGHFGDVISVKRFGFLEHMVLLEENTHAPGIIAHIGSLLEGCKISALRPEKIRKL